MLIAARLPRSALHVLLALGFLWRATQGEYSGLTRRELALITGTRGRSTLRRAVRLAAAAGVIASRPIAGARAYVLTAKGARALLELVSR